MSIGALQNAMRLQALRAMSGQASARVGIVRSYDPANFAARVELQPEGVMSGWLPIASQWVGAGWGMVTGAGIGDMVAVAFFGADLEAGVIVGRLFNDEDRPPAAPSGELWLVHASGASIKLLNSGAAALDDGHGATVTLNGDGTISSAGAWTHAGTFTATEVTAGGKHLTTHKHGGVSTGGGQTGVPV